MVTNLVTSLPLFMEPMVIYACDMFTLDLHAQSQPSLFGGVLKLKCEECGKVIAGQMGFQTGSFQLRPQHHTLVAMI